MEDYGVFWLVTVLNPDGSTPPEPVSFGGGTKLVGSEVPAGTYRTRVASSGCYWERLRGFGGGLADIIANENTDYPEVVTIAPTDRGFSSARCATWTNNLTPITTSTTAPFGGGTFIVGVDIAPGTWRALASPGCYWARLAGFSGQFSELLANDNNDGSAIVTIAASDKGFRSHRCGAWTKIG